VTEIQVRPAVHSELGAVAQIYARAFQHDPVYEWLLPDDAERGARLPVLFAAFVRHLHRGTGALDVAVRERRLVGAALWDRPGVVATGAWRAARALPGLLRASGRRLPALAELGSTLESARPSSPHWYLFHLAADPAEQGGGVGSALLGAGLDRAAGATAYLECKLALVGYYGRAGFARTGTLSVGGGAVTMAAMTRPDSRTG
jgi:ribosomal protein S18 acetylase RimI-like enzyme